MRRADMGSGWVGDGGGMGDEREMGERSHLSSFVYQARGKAGRVKGGWEGGGDKIQTPFSESLIYFTILFLVLLCASDLGAKSKGCEWSLSFTYD